MEAAGVAIGVAGLAGLFSSVLEVVNAFHTYKTFTADSEALRAQFEADRVRFQHWGQALKLDKGRLSDEETASLALDPKRYAAIKGLLDVVNRILDEGDNQRGRENDGPASVHGQLSHDLLGDSMRHKLKWAIRGKAERKEQVQIFGMMVQKLYELVPLSNAPDGTNLGPAVGSSSIPRLDDVIKVLNSIESRGKLDRQRQLRSWILGKSTPNERYSDSLRRRLTGTCDWIFHKADFHKWLSDDALSTSPKSLWINGHAGFGKTVLCAKVAEHLSSTTDHPVAHFFFSSDYANGDDPYVVMRSWLVQLISSHEKTFDIAYSELDEQEIASRSSIVSLFSKVLRQVPGCILVVDGLDECIGVGGQSSLTSRFIGDLASALAQDTRLLIVSRDEIDIRQGLADLGNLSEITVSRNDVALDTKALARHLVDLKLPNKTEMTRIDLAERMRDRCDGQFLWLTMQERSLRKGMTRKDLQVAIDETPTGLGFIYDRNWQRIVGLRSWDQDRAISILRWATFSLQPLTVSQMAEAVIVDGNCDEFPAEDIPDDMEAYLESEILGLCSPLIEVCKTSSKQPAGSQVIQVAHFSVKQYLIAHLPIGSIEMNEGLRLSNEIKHHRHLAQLCLRFIRNPAVWNDQTSKDSPLTCPSFREYAIGHWHVHIRSGGAHVDAHLADLTLEFMNEGFPTWNDWRSWFDQISWEAGILDWEIQPPKPLYYAVLLRLIDVALRMIQMRQSGTLDASKDARSPLHLASANGDVSVIKAMLDGGVDVDSRHHKGFTALHMAALHGRIEVARLLIDRGASMTAMLDTTAMPIHLAVVGGHLRLVQLLLENGFAISTAEGDPHTRFGWNLTHLAVSYDNAELLKILIDHGADISLRDGSGFTPIHIAARDGLLKVISLLLESGAEIDVATSTGMTPLYLAAYNGYFSITNVLLQKGASIDPKTSSGETPLVRAALEGHFHIIELLLEHGTDIAHEDGKGATVLHWAAITGKAEIIRVLLNDPRVLVNKKDNNGRTPLILAAKGGHHAAVKMLLADQRVVPSECDFWGNTALIAASRNGHKEISALLLSVSGSDTREGFSHPLLWWLQRGTSSEVIAMFSENTSTPQSRFLGFRLSPQCITVDQTGYYCDICTLPMSPEYYHCDSCDGGDFDICSSCYKLGFRCREESHGGGLREMVLSIERG